MKTNRIVFVGLALIAAVAALLLQGRLDRSVLPDRPNLADFPAAFASALAAAEDAVSGDASDGAAWLELGVLYHANGYNQRAAYCYERALASEVATPERARAQYYLADLSLLSSDQETARARLSEALRSAPDYAPGWTLVGDLAFKSSDLDGALAAYKRAWELDASSPHARLGVARVHLQRGEDREALELLESIVSEHPAFNRGVGLLAKALDRVGQSERAQATRAASKSLWDMPPEDPWLSAIRERSFDAQRLGFYFEELKNVGRYEEAIGYLDRILRLHPENARAYEMKGLALVEQKRFEEALRAYRNALERGGDPAGIYPELLKTLATLGRVEESAVVADEALAAAPDSPDTLVEVAGARLMQDRPAEAFSILERALEVDPYHRKGVRALARLLFRSGQHEKAMVPMQRLRQLEPDDLYSRVAIGSYHLDEGRPQEALEPLQEARRLAPQDADVAEMLAAAHSGIGASLLAAGDAAGAQSRFEQALSVQPEMRQAQIGMLQALLAQERFDQAESHILGLIESNPRVAELRVALGDVRFAMERRGEAIASWERALEMARSGSSVNLPREIEARLAAARSGDP